MDEARTRDHRSGPIVLLAIVTIVCGLIVFTTPWTLDHPGRRWLWRWAQPGWPIGVGALWMLCGVGALLLARRARVATALLLIAAICQPLVLLVAGCDGIGCGYGWWHAQAGTILTLDVAAAIVAFGSGVILGRVSVAPRSRGAWVVLGTLLALAAGLVLSLALLASVWADVVGTSSGTIAASLLLAVGLSVVAGIFIGRGLHPGASRWRHAPRHAT